MDPANLHIQHNQLLEPYFPGYYSSLLSQPVFRVPSDNDLNHGINLNTSLNEYIPTSKEALQLLRATSVSEGLGFSEASIFSQQSAASKLQLSKIKDKKPGCFPKLSEMLYNPCNVEDHSEVSFTKYKEPYTDHQSLVESYDLPVRNFSSDQRHLTELQLSGGDLCSNVFQNFEIMRGHYSCDCSRYNLCNILPVSTLDLSSSLVSSSLDLNLQAMDHLAPPATASNSSQSQKHCLGRFPQDPRSSTSNSSNKWSISEDGLGRKKRPNNNSSLGSKIFALDVKKVHSAAKPSCPPLKIRKEKLGDRIASLQRLVAPYGKTDTASVLTEAIGYIHFLHDQMQTLSVPSMKSSSRKSSMLMQVSSGQEDGKRQPNRDLRSRGLCLVPISCASYFNSYSAGI